MTEHLDDLLTYEEAAREIGIALGSVKQAVNRGLLHPIKIPRERHKFLRREEVLRYRDGRQAYLPAQNITSQSAAPKSSQASEGALPSSVPYQEILETLQMLILLEGMRLSHLASIREAVIGLAEGHSAAFSDLAALPPQQLYQAARRNDEQTFGTGPQHSPGEGAASLAHLVSETLAQLAVHTDADEQTIQQLQDLLALYTQSKTPNKDSHPSQDMPS